MGGLAVKALVTTVNTLTTQPGLANHSAQRPALVRGTFVAEEHGAGLNSPLGGIVEYTDIGVKADNQIALLRLQANLRGSIGAAEADNVLECILGILVFRGRSKTLATTEICPKDGQA